MNAIRRLLIAMLAASWPLTAAWSTVGDLRQQATSSYLTTNRPLTALSATADTNDIESSSRRQLFRNLGIGGAVLVAAGVANKKSIDGPPPFVPAPHSLDGKVIVITGGTSGLGLESGKRLAAAGATVILTCRTAAKGQAAVQSVQDYLKEQNVSNDQVYTVPLDLDDLSSVKDFPKLFTKLPVFSKGKPSIDVLMNNAGVMAVPDKRITRDGFEKTFQSNHLGHFALTALLFPMLSKNARVINVSSAAYLFASKGLPLDNLNGEQEYGPWSSYGNSKLANILFTKELQRRADEAGLSITVVALHPGGVRTDLGRYLMGEDKYTEMQKTGVASPTDNALLQVLAYFTRSVESGASTQVYLASGEGGGGGGEFFTDMKPVQVKDAALDMEKAKALWDVSEKLSGVKFNL